MSIGIINGGPVHRLESPPVPLAWSISLCHAFCELLAFPSARKQDGSAESARSQRRTAKSNADEVCPESSERWRNRGEIFSPLSPPTWIASGWCHAASRFGASVAHPVILRTYTHPRGRAEPPAGRRHAQLQAHHPLWSFEGRGSSEAVPRPAASAPPGLPLPPPSRKLQVRWAAGVFTNPPGEVDGRWSLRSTALRHNTLSLHQCPRIFLVTGIKYDSCKILAADYICLFNCMQNACQEGFRGLFLQSLPLPCIYSIQLFGDCLCLRSKLQSYKPF